MKRTALRTVVARAVSLTAAVAAGAVALAPAASAADSGAERAPSYTKVAGSAAYASGLRPTVDYFRALVGDPDNGSTPGSQPGGRREINWDAVPDALSSPALLPPDAFNTAVPRGAVFASSAGDEFVVSNSAASGVGVRFGDINPQYKYQFGTFSPEKLFAPLGTTTTRVRFFEPGTQTPAYVNGFGAVFTDVDTYGSSSIAAYDRWGHRLWKGDVPKGPKAAKSLSFLGVKTSAKIYEVRITSGNVPLDPWNLDGGWKDVVAIDDLVYGEPEHY